VFGRSVNGHGDKRLVGGGFVFLDVSLFLRHKKTAGFRVSAIEVAIRNICRCCVLLFPEQDHHCFFFFANKLDCVL
jgi:hypothetical protein